MIRLPQLSTTQMENIVSSNITNQEIDEISIRGGRQTISFEDFTRKLREYVREFCETSSVQGLSYLVKNISILERIWWILVLTTGILGSCFMVYHIFDKWTTSPVLVSLATQESTIGDIPFPAVTICPETKISQTCLNYTKILRARKKGNILLSEMEQNLYFDLMALLCKSENHDGTASLIEKNFEEYSEEYYIDEGSSPDKPHEFVIQDYSNFLTECSAVKLESAICKWMGQMVECKEVLFPVITDEGLCYSFNMYDVRDIYSNLNSMEYFTESNRRRDWDPDEGYKKDTTDFNDWYPRRALRSGSNNGFTAIFLTQKEDINYACRDISLQGLRVSLHTPTRLARPGQVFFSVGLGQLTLAAVIPSLTSTSKKIKAYNPEKRGCYFGHERQLKYFKFYSQSNCNLECWTNYTQQQCGCVNFYMPRDSNTEVCNLQRRFCLEDARKSYTRNILKERLGSKISDSISETTCHCLSLCSDLTFNAEVTTSEFDIFNDDEIMFDDLKYAASLVHVSAVKVYFKNNYFLPTRRSELYGTTDLISNVGGILGLIMGFSLMSLGEILYFLLIRPIANYRRYGYWKGPQHSNEE